MSIPELKLWKVRVQLVDPENNVAYREDEYEFRGADSASKAAFNACDLLAESDYLISINGEVLGGE